MDDNTIFQNPNEPAPQGVQENQAVPNPIEAQENPFAPPLAPVGVTSAPEVSSPFPPPPPANSTFSFLSIGNLIKVFVGIVVIFVLFFLFFKIVPGLFNKNNKQVTLSYWGLWEDVPTMQGVISDFERQNPNIKINYLKQDVKQYREAITTRMQNGTGPDIFRFHNTWFPMFKNYLLPMSSDIVTKQEFSKNFYPVAQKDLVKNGAIYGIPLEVDTLSLFVNTEFLQSAGISTPTNWQDFINAARQLTVKDSSGKIKTAGAALGAFDNITHAPDIISLLLVQNGAKLEDLSSTQKQASDALSFYTSFAKGDGNVWDSTLDPSILSFSGGNLAMYFGYSWDYFAIKAANPNLPFAIFPVPHLPGQNQTIASYWVEGVSSKSRNQKESLLFMKYLAKRETAQKLFSEESKTRLFGEPYGRSDLAITLKDNATAFPFVSQAENATSSFFADSTFDNGLNSQMNTYLGNAIRSILNDTSPSSAIDTLSKGVSQVLTQYGQ